MVKGKRPQKTVKLQFVDSTMLWCMRSAPGRRQKAQLDGFTHEHRHDDLKGRTFGSAVENCPGLV